MDRRALTELHFLTPIDNLVSISQRGILSHDLAAQLPHVDVSNTDVQGTRSGKFVEYDGQTQPRLLHSYANLFLHGRNSMLSALCHRYGHPALAVLRVHSSAFDLPGAVIADQNAASDYASFYASPDGLRWLDEEFVLARHWGDEREDQIDYWRRKSRRSAELLVPDVIAPEMITGGYVSCEPTQKRCNALGLPWNFEVNLDLFFLV